MLAGDDLLIGRDETVEEEMAAVATSSSVFSTGVRVGGGGLTPIQEFFHEKNVFITGASGFMGKVLLEKLLRSCPSVGNVFILLRAKKGELPADRVRSLLDTAVFERLRRERGINVLHRVVAISGDIQRPGLAISPEDRAMLISNVHVVFHVAATVRFDEKLKNALQTNLAGTKAVLQLARELQNLKSMVYVSTAYSYSPRNEIDEVVYNPPVDPEQVLTSMEWLSEEQMDVLSPSLLGPWPNTYAYSKMLAENLVNKYAENMPVSIFRPAIVTSTNREPVPGWIDNMNGPAGITVGVQVGVIRSFRCDSSLKVDLVPVDMAANAMLACAWATANTTPCETKVYNFVSSAQKPIRWFEYIRYCENYGLKNPSQQAIWYYSLIMTPRRGLQRFLSLLLHDIPARVMDLMAAVMGKPQKMTKMYNKIDKFNDLMSYFTVRQWEFSDKNVRTLHDALTPEDRTLFPFDLSSLSWETYIKNYIAGIRLHLLNEKPDNLKVARNRYFVLYLLHRSVQLGFVYSVFRLIFSMVSLFNRIKNRH